MPIIQLHATSLNGAWKYFFNGVETAKNFWRQMEHITVFLQNIIHNFQQNLILLI